MTHASPGAIVTDWAGAGAFAGLCLGAAFGLVFGSILAGFGPFALTASGVGVLLGGLGGLVSGVAIGLINGVVLALLFSAGMLGVTDDGRRRRAALAAGLTSALVSLPLFDWVLGAIETTWPSVDAAAAVATLAGVALSQILEPSRRDARSCRPS